MGYDVGASILQGWKLNDFFEGYCEEEMELFRQTWEEGELDADENKIPNGLEWDDMSKSGVDVFGVSYESEEKYIGIHLGGVSNRGGNKEQLVVLANSAEILVNTGAILRRLQNPLFHMVADMLPTKPIQTYMILYESY
jgi:hypothetical protein